MAHLRSPASRCSLSIAPCPLRPELSARMRVAFHGTGSEPLDGGSPQQKRAKSREELPHERARGRRQVPEMAVVAAQGTTTKSCQSSGTPFKECVPRSSNTSSEPATRSLTVLETTTSEGPDS